MITEYITERDKISDRPYDPRQEVEREVRDHIDYMFSEYDGESLKSDLVFLSAHPNVLLRKVLLELIEVSVVGLFEKVQSEGWTEENKKTLGHILELIETMPITQEMAELFARLIQLICETPTPYEARRIVAH